MKHLIRFWDGTLALITLTGIIGIIFAIASDTGLHVALAGFIVVVSLYLVYILGCIVELILKGE